MPAETVAERNTEAGRIFVSLFAEPVRNVDIEPAGRYDSTKQLYVDESGKSALQSLAESTYCQTSMTTNVDGHDDDIHYEVCD